ncbi:MAG: complex I NDUFA9 subunit family protein [Deltaproteobacteria bacterium]|nr:complex I NDUFA9 subunit family protein [Deltaproteobacteria bacterium]
MILLTGATGFVGGSLVHRMLKEKLHVRCLVRSYKKAETLNAIGVETAIGDITDKSSILKAMEGVETVVHLVGILVEVGKATFDLMHTEGTRNMVEAAKEKGIKRFIHMSALGTRQDAKSKYHKTKLAAEEIVKNSGLDYAIFRPSVIFGREDNFTNMFAKAIKMSPFIMVPGSGKNKMQPVSVKDVAEAITAAVVDKRFAGTYELGGPEKLTFDEIIDKICGILNKKRSSIYGDYPSKTTFDKRPTPYASGR